ncbi:hypothetical protein PG997_000238 [Apiospora hydei]|uniref:Glycoside hydrolase n=1 Tax=Apiospora hydei TaxID=1337664 RepID=A0ABR1XAB4_9PEZI
MLGINQLPAGAEGVAAFSLIYATVSWTCSALFIMVARVYREGLSYLSILAFFTLFSTTASIIQQAHDITWYRDVMIAQFEHKKDNPDSPENAIANGSIGLDLVLYYLQYYSYSVEAMLVMFWAGELTQTVYGLSAKRRLRPLLRRINTVGKWIAIMFPMVTILLLRLPALQAYFLVFILVADLPLMISLAIGSGTVVAILARYINSRKSITNWTPQQGTGNTNQSGTTNTMSSSQGKTPTRQGLYDRWLMVRFTCAFVVLAAFEVTNTLFQVQSVLNTRKDTASVVPDLSVERARSTFYLFIPGNTPGIFVFLVFGTTAGCRKAMYNIFVPQGCRRSEGSKGGCIPLGPRRKRAVPVVIHADPESGLFDQPDDTRSYTTLTGRSEATKTPDLNKPLPVVAMSRYNKSYRGERDSPSPSPSPQWQQYRGDRVQGVEVEGQGGIPLHHMRSLDSVQEEYYQPQAEQSDDSGPMLPIMREQGSYVARGSPRRTPLGSGRGVRRPSISIDYGRH